MNRTTGTLLIFRLFSDIRQITVSSHLPSAAANANQISTLSHLQRLPSRKYSYKFRPAVARTIAAD